MYKDTDREMLRELKIMNSVIEKGFKKMNDTIDKGFKDMNKSLFRASKNVKKDDWDWNPVHGPNKLLPTKEQGWVLVKIRRFDSIDVDKTPHIALYLGEDNWKTLETQHTYYELGYSVDYWRPLPE